MSRKELMDRLFARVPASDREAFLSEIRRADTFDDRLAVVEKCFYSNLGADSPSICADQSIRYHGMVITKAE